MVLSSWDWTNRNDKELRRQLNKYMVLIDTYPEAEYHYVNVGTDDFGGGAMIAKYLLDNGYTQAIFAAECDTGADHYRWKGFQHQMRSAGIDCGEERHILLPEDLSLRRVMYGHYLDRFVQARAVALASDYDAAEVMNYLQDHGIQVPEQVSVTGFDDCIYAELMHPPSDDSASERPGQSRGRRGTAGASDSAGTGGV